MKYSSLFSLSIISLGVGILLLAVHNEWIVISITHQRKTEYSQPIDKKNISLHFWHNNNWVIEHETVLWNSEPSHNIQSVVASWLSIMDTEQYASKKVSLESVILAPNNHLYISFDRHPFSKESSTIDKLMWLEGLLTTLKNAHLGLQSVHFLVHHKPLLDSHIDCTRPWPIDGFLPYKINA